LRALATHAQSSDVPPRFGYKPFYVSARVDFSPWLSARCVKSSAALRNGSHVSKDCHCSVDERWNARWERRTREVYLRCSTVTNAATTCGRVGNKRTSVLPGVSSHVNMNGWNREHKQGDVCARRDDQNSNVPLAGTHRRHRLRRREQLPVLRTARLLQTQR
jgi:hypothetical protein